MKAKQRAIYSSFSRFHFRHSTPAGNLRENESPVCTEVAHKRSIPSSGDTSTRLPLRPLDGTTNCDHVLVNRQSAGGKTETWKTNKEANGERQKDGQTDGQAGMMLT